MILSFQYYNALQFYQEMLVAPVRTLVKITDDAIVESEKRLQKLIHIPLLANLLMI